MDEQRWKRVQDLFEEALERAPAEREAFLRVACGDDELRREVASLLRHHADTGTLFGAPSAVAHDLLFDTSHGPVEGRLLGPYRIEREIGSGGMGRVFLARREDIPKRVALKLVREPLASPDRVRRFRLEQRLLASLEHPHVAQLVDAGITEDGTPWFAMEHVDGEPITAFCDRLALPVPDRLRLFLDVCAAVRYAHAHLIVHRDIKPSNILVTGDGRAKLLDFGVAKLLTSEADPGLTGTGMRLFTPRYAAPEQLAGDPASTATDVYQLGALLYELVVGRPPLGVDGLVPLEAERVIREEDPMPPSSAVLRERTGPGGDGAAAAPSPADVGAARSTTPERLSQRLRGDLDNVVLKALEKRPERRYPSVDALAGDIERFLSGHPISARPSTRAYRLKKLVLRNRIAAGVALLVVGYAVTVTASAASISRERDRAEREATTARRVSEFLVGVFTRADPTDTVPGEVTALELARRGAERVEDELADDPEIRAAMQEVLGRVYHGFGRSEEAERLLRGALAARLAVFGPESLEVASSRHYLAQVLWAAGDLAAADTLDRQALEVRRARLPPEDERLWETLNDLGTVRHMQGRLEEAEELLGEAIELARAASPDGHVQLGGYLSNLANVRFAAGDYGGARAMMEQALDSDLRFLPPDHPSIALRLDNLAYMALRADRFDEALGRAEEALAMYWRVYGAPHPDMPYAMTTIAEASMALGDTAGADTMHVRALEMRRSLSGPDGPDLFMSHRDFGRHLLATGRSAQAVPHLREALRVARLARGEDHEWYGTALWDLGRARQAQGDPEQAEALLRRAYDVHVAALGVDHPVVADERAYLFELLRGSGREAEAEAFAAPPADSTGPPGGR